MKKRKILVCDWQGKLSQLIHSSQLPIMYVHFLKDIYICWDPEQLCYALANALYSTINSYRKIVDKSPTYLYTILLQLTNTDASHIHISNSYLACIQHKVYTYNLCCTKCIKQLASSYGQNCFTNQVSIAIQQVIFHH